MSEYGIRPMEIGDIDAVHAIESATFSSPWSRDAFGQEMQNPCAYYLVLESAEGVIGFAGTWIILDEGHITNIAIIQAQRGKGYGEALTQRLIDDMLEQGVTFMTLEVRVSNAVAQALYKKLGFKKAGVRKKYYEDDGEDAYIMIREIVRA